jgi:hypothetical protein
MANQGERTAYVVVWSNYGTLIQDSIWTSKKKAEARVAELNASDSHPYWYVEDLPLNRAGNG